MRMYINMIFSHRSGN